MQFSSTVISPTPLVHICIQNIRLFTEYTKQTLIIIINTLSRCRQAR